MAQTDVAGTSGGGARVWLFRILILAAAGYMLVTWFTPWWSADVNGLPGKDHLVMRPWGVEVVAQVRANADPALYSMPWFFQPFMWAYLAVCMLALAASLFIERRISLGRFSLSLPQVLILLVGLSYLVAVGMAFGVAQVKAGWAGANFIGTSTIKNAMTGNKVKMVADLQLGYWLALGAGPVLIVLGLLRGLILGKPKG